MNLTEPDRGPKQSCETPAPWAEWPVSMLFLCMTLWIYTTLRVSIDQYLPWCTSFPVSPVPQGATANVMSNIIDQVNLCWSWCRKLVGPEGAEVFKGKVLNSVWNIGVDIFFSLWKWGFVYIKLSAKLLLCRDPQRKHAHIMYSQIINSESKEAFLTVGWDMVIPYSSAFTLGLVRVWKRNAKKKSKEKELVTMKAEDLQFWAVMAVKWNYLWDDCVF